MYARPALKPRPRKSRSKSFRAPNGGWIANRNLAEGNDPRLPAGAEVLDNFFPTASGAKLRRGSSLYATLGEGITDVTSLFSYKKGTQEQLFGATASTIYDITTILDPEPFILVTDEGDELVTDLGDNLGVLSTDGLERITGQTGGDWVTVQFATSGGTFLSCVNGTDPMLVYDGQYFTPVDASDIYTLNYSGGSAAFTVGETVTGGTSGATAVIRNIFGSEASGTLIIDTLSGNFQNAEALTDGEGGSANANGTEAAKFTGIDEVDTATLTHVWAYKRRLFFVQKNTLDAWYLATDAVAGTATKFPLGGVFTKGGSLLFGASWSYGTGASGGLSEQCVFITSEGEVAVYQGSDPASADTWALVGVYRIGKPLGKKSFQRLGSDLAIGTDIGLLALSMALNSDFAALAPNAVSFNIEDAWNVEVAARSGAQWHCEVWPSKQMFVLALPTVNEQSPQMFVANTTTGAWCRFTGWNGTCLEVFKERLFFGSENGQIIEGGVTGYDIGHPYTGSFVPLFDDLGSPGSLKTATLARAVVRSKVEIDDQVSCQSDFQVDLPADPDASPVSPGSQWDVGTWDVSVWGEEAATITQQPWRSVFGHGYSLAPALQVTSGAVVPLDAELVRLDLVFGTADLVS